jgi:hypothetical protein
MFHLLNRFKSFTLSIGILTLPLQAHSSFETLTPPSYEEFVAQLHQVYQFKSPSPENLPSLYSDKRYKNLTKGDVVYLPIKHMAPGQGSFSFRTVQEKIKNAPRYWGVNWVESQGKWILPRNQFTALHPYSKSALGILLKDVILIIDGNHKILTSLYYGASTAPVRILKNWSDLTLEQALPKLRKKGYVFPYNTEGEILNEWPNFKDIQDNPYRYLAIQLLLKCQIEVTNGSLKVKNLRGQSQPLICKINRDLPFLELHLSRLWKLRGLEYNSDEEPSEETINQAKQIVLDEFKMESTEFSFLKNILILDPPIEVSSVSEPTKKDIKNLTDRIDAYLKTRTKEECEDLLADNYF